MEPETTKKDRLQGLLAGAKGGLSGLALGGGVNLGLLPLKSKIREAVFAGKNPLPGFSTGTIPEVSDLLNRLATASGYEPAKGRSVAFQPLSKPSAEFVQEFLIKNPRDLFRISAGVSPEAIAHEVGHATVKTAPEKILRRASQIARFPVGKSPMLKKIPIAELVPSLMALSAALNPDEELPAVAKAAPYVGGAILATNLLEETRANLRGAKALEAIGKKMSLLNKAKMFLPTTTYLSRLGVLVGLPYGISKGIEAYRKATERGHNLTPMQAAGIPTASLENLPTSQELSEKWKERLSR